MPARDIMTRDDQLRAPRDRLESAARQLRVDIGSRSAAEGVSKPIR
jgi:hypothetical protein